MTWEPTRWWRAVGPGGRLWCESSDEREVREQSQDWRDEEGVVHSVHAEFQPLVVEQLMEWTERRWVPRAANPYLPAAPADGEHVYKADFAAGGRCSLCGAYEASPESTVFCRGNYAESSKMRGHAERRWREERPKDESLAAIERVRACIGFFAGEDDEMVVLVGRSDSSDPNQRVDITLWLGSAAGRQMTNPADPLRADCTSCGMSNPKCWARCMRYSKPCCASCHLNDTHPLPVDPMACAHDGCVKRSRFFMHVGNPTRGQYACRGHLAGVLKEQLKHFATTVHVREL